ncbi:hypothetical protein [Swingsia samuiensis]|nr:hypothetical protein [Swingsia samuiensis]
MTHLTHRAGLYYVRFIVPKDRWQDVGKVLNSSTGLRRDILKSLQTRHYKEALKLRDAALNTIRQEINHKLIQAGFSPLHGHAVPDWMDEAQFLQEALKARQALQIASTVEDDQGTEDWPFSESPRDRLLEGMECFLEDQAYRMDQAGQNGQAYASRFEEIALGQHTPFALILDRWMRDRESSTSHSSQSLDRATLNHFARYLAHSKGLEEPEDLMAFLRQQVVEEIPPRVLGGFVEWLMDVQGLSVKTASNRVTPLKVMWDFAIQKHLLPKPNPWMGATAGLKQRANRQKIRLRPFSEEELMALLKADPDEGRRWNWGSAIYDLMRLALLTGARQNELASLTVDRVMTDPHSKGVLWGIRITDQEAKTRNAVRSIPLHPLIQPIIARRLKAADQSNPNAPLFPECKPGGPGEKRSYYFAKRFPVFRRDVLGVQSDKLVDFHSFRRNFITFFERANAHGVSACTEMVRDRLVGHESRSLAGNTYAAQDLGWDLCTDAILGLVEKGMPQEVVEVLRE